MHVASRRTVRVRAVVDATGRQGLLARKFALRSRRTEARQCRGLLALRGRSAARGRPAERHPHRRPRRRRLVLADSDQRRADQRRRGGAQVDLHAAAARLAGRDARAGDRRHAGGRRADARRPPRVAGAGREGLLLQRLGLRRRALDPRRRRRLVPRPGLLHRRLDRHGVRHRSGERARSGARPQRLLGAAPSPVSRAGRSSASRSSAASCWRSTPPSSAISSSSPIPRPFIFRAVVTVLAGNWRPRLWTRFLIEIFFVFVELQRRFKISPPLFRRDAAAGYPTRGPA